MASERVEGSRAASERPPLAEAAHRLTSSGGCRNWDRASGSWLYARMPLAVPKSRRANEKYYLPLEKETKSLFVSETKRLFVSGRFSAENEKPFRFAQQNESKTKASRKQNESKTKGKRKANERQTKAKRKLRSAETYIKVSKKAILEPPNVVMFGW